MNTSSIIDLRAVAGVTCRKLTLIERVVHLSISRFAILLIVVFFGTSMQAADYLNMEALKLTSPTMEPRLTPEVINNYHKEQTLLLEDHAPWAKENWTWMRTNPDVKPYKLMDDLTFVGIPLFTAGIIAKSEKHAFRQNDGSKHVLLTDFKTGIDDYTQFFGPAMTVGLKVGGVEGRSDWGRLLASAAMSYGFMAGFVNGIKYTAKEMRPDGTTANSWPSGHTATAFVGATILHKEYGLTRSPWYSVAGYGVATATGVMRVLNNRHWISDVLSGAGIGIMSGELAYALSDVLFKEKGLLRGDISGERSIIDHPSFFSVSMGIGFGSRDMNFDMGKFDFNEEGDNDFNLKFGASTAVGAEGAYFFNKYIGLGGRLRVNSSPIKGWDGIEEYAWSDIVTAYVDLMEEPDLEPIAFGQGTPETDGYHPPYVNDVYMTIKSDHLTEFAFDVGVYFNYPLSSKFALGSKLLIGRSIMQEIDLNATVSGGQWDFDTDGNDNFFDVKYLGNYETEWDYFTVSANNTMKFGTGISLTYAYKNNFSWRVFLDYDFSHKTYTMVYNPGEYMFSAFPHILGDFFNASDFIETQSVKKNRHTFILGGAFVVSF